MQTAADIHALRAQALEYKNKGDIDKAIFLLRECLRDEGYDQKALRASVLYHLGLAYVMQKKAHQAAECFRECLRFDPLHTKAYHHLYPEHTIPEACSGSEMSGIIPLPSRASRRGYLNIGYPCDLRCQFCYYHFRKEESPFISLDQACREIDRMRDLYGLNAVDISGGEPTLYKELPQLIRYARKRQIAPSVITHGNHLVPKYVDELVSAGLADFLISVHGLDEVYDRTVGKRCFHVLDQNLRALKEKGLAFRTNTTVSSLNVDQLVDIAAYLKDLKPLVANLIVFNPGYEWKEKDEISFSAPYVRYAEPIHEAIDILEPQTTVNVRFYPFCFMKGYEKNNSNFQQQGYDPYEWSFYQKVGCTMADVTELARKGSGVAIYAEEAAEVAYNAFARQQEYDQNCKSRLCMQCAYEKICSGFFDNYVRIFGFKAEPVGGPAVIDPLFFRKQDPARRIYGF